tara:strand:- start:506 stop:757 length:252 start_codon:yes stop_codon:yes gene_type:complete
MENTEIHFEMTVSNRHDEWNEKITGYTDRDGDVPSPTTDKEAVEVAKKTIARFNASLRPHELERKLRCVQRIETKVIDLIEYN